MTSSPDVEAPNIETHVFTPGEDVPNNKLPLVLYRGALGSEGDLAVRCEEMFHAHGWPGPWRNGIYGHHHYHTATRTKCWGSPAARRWCGLAAQAGRQSNCARATSW